jgi:hypothetical protein
MVCKDLNTQDVDDDVHQHFDHLLKNKVGADVTFEVSGETFVAHRCVLAARSKVFMAQLFGPMTEGTTSTVIQIKDMEAKVFVALLSFIYTDSFPKLNLDINVDEERRQDEEEEQNEEEKGQGKVEEGQDKEQGQDEEEAQDEERGQEEHVMWQLTDMICSGSSPYVKVGCLTTYV